MGLQGLERRLERTVDGVFSRAFRSKLKPIELGRRLVREMDDNRSVDVRGRTIVPNAFTFTLAPEDHDAFAEIHDALIRELADVAREHAGDEGYSFMGTVEIEITGDDQLRTGRFELASHMHEPKIVAPPATIVLGNGNRIPLVGMAQVIGRLPECDIPVPDPNVSRRHAEIRPAPTGTGYVVVDLKSTNGTRVNGFVVTEEKLTNGDIVTVGATHLRYEGP